LRGHFDETFIPLNRVRFALVPRGKVKSGHQQALGKLSFNMLQALQESAVPDRVCTAVD
jgi:hypothetical protein